MSDQEECKCPPEGLPAWMGTFADLMSLLMCFFVLLLAFSEMDVQKFKQLAGSMKNAFGVQNKVEVKDIPKGTSVIAQEFSPGRPQPTPVQAVMQHTQEMTEDVLEFNEEEEAEEEGQGENVDEGQGVEEDISFHTDPSTLETEKLTAAEQAQAEKEAHELAKKIAIKVGEELASEQLEIEAVGRIVIIRIKEKGSFLSGSDNIKPGFRPVLRKIRDILKTTDGRFYVVGHTDNLPIDTERFRSNWELSAARAVSVVHELLRTKEIESTKFEVSGVADTQPIGPNDTTEGRAANRRVEIRIIKGVAQSGKVLSVDKSNKGGGKAKQNASQQKGGDG